MRGTKDVSKVVACVAVLLVAALCAVPSAHAKQIALDAALGTPVMLAGQKQTAYLRVAMEGFEFEDESKRPPVNVAIVLDKSGSMQGEKIAKAKEAAIMAIDRLRADDIVSVVVYDATVHVVVPATKASDRPAIYAAINRVNAHGSTALFAGVSKGAHEVRKFLDDQRVNRIILLSDGLANVGPSSPGDLAELGTSLGANGISVSTIGLGLDYSEDLMTKLAANSDGNHYFAQSAEDLRVAFNGEFSDVLSVVAQDVNVRIQCADGVRPVRAVGREADIDGRTVTTSLNQLYSRQMKYLVLELELPPGESGQEMDVAKVEVSYANKDTHTTDRLQSIVSATFTASPGLVEEKTDPEVMAATVYQIGAEQNRLAMQLRDQGKLEEGQRVLQRNADYLTRNADKFKNEELRGYAKFNGSLAITWQDGAGDWNRQRKAMRQSQQVIKSNQSQVMNGWAAPDAPSQKAADPSNR